MKVRPKRKRNAIKISEKVNHETTAKLELSLRK